MLPIAATLVRERMERRPEDVERARTEFDAQLERARDRVRELETAVALIERATEDGLRAASSDGERAETFRASALHAGGLAGGDRGGRRAGAGNGVARRQASGGRPRRSAAAGEPAAGDRTPRSRG